MTVSVRMGPGRCVWGGWVGTGGPRGESVILLSEETGPRGLSVGCTKR